MTRNIIFFLFFFYSIHVFSQDKKNADKTEVNPKSKIADELQTGTKKSKVATIDMYKIISLQKDTTYVDTSLTIKRYYAFNYLRKDLFGFLPFANEGQPLMVLDYGRTLNVNPLPEIGYTGKHFNYIGYKDVNYYSVATPFTELYYKTVLDKGQSLDAFITINTSKRLNFSLAYKGLRSNGKYINQLTSNGNLRFTSSYRALNGRYEANFHFTSQDLSNQENGGIINVQDFESGSPEFKNRQTLAVYLTDARSYLRGNRIFLDHSFRINSENSENNIFLIHQLNYEAKFFEYTQNTIQTTIDNSSVNRFGDAYVGSNLVDQAHYNRMYNKIGAIYENNLLGRFQFFAEDFRYNYYFDKVLILDKGIIPNVLNDKINTVGGQYEYRKNKWNGIFTYSNSVTNQGLSNLDAKMRYKVNAKNELVFQYQMLNKLPDNIYNLHQSNYVNYNWSNDFKNEKIKNLTVDAKTQWLNAALMVTSLNDHLYFSNDSNSGQQLISPKQYGKAINYLSVKASREFKYGKFALDNTLLFQQVSQNEDILNVPKFVTRNSLYFTDYCFKKALFLQTGFTFNYFTKYFANDYNPVISESFVQNHAKVGNFPMFDFFLNAKIRQTRIFVIAEHFNSSFTGYNYYTAPNYPYRDFIVRFGLVWNFFK